MCTRKKSLVVDSLHGDLYTSQLHWDYNTSSKRMPRSLLNNQYNETVRPFFFSVAHMEFDSTLALDYSEMLVGLQTGTWQNSSCWNPSEDLWGQICVLLEATWTTTLRGFACVKPQIHPHLVSAYHRGIWFQHHRGRPAKMKKRRNLIRTTIFTIYTFPSSGPTPQKIRVGDFSIKITTSTLKFRQCHQIHPESP